MANARFMKVGNQGSVTVTTKQQVLEVPVNVTISISPEAAIALRNYLSINQPTNEELVDLGSTLEILLRDGGVFDRVKG